MVPGLMVLGTDEQHHLLAGMKVIRPEFTALIDFGSADVLQTPTQTTHTQQCMIKALFTLGLRVDVLCNYSVSTNKCNTAYNVCVPQICHTSATGMNSQVI